MITLPLEIQSLTLKVYIVFCVCIILRGFFLGKWERAGVLCTKSIHSSKLKHSVISSSMNGKHLIRKPFSWTESENTSKKYHTKENKSFTRNKTKKNQQQNNTGWRKIVCKNVINTSLPSPRVICRKWVKEKARKLTQSTRLKRTQLHLDDVSKCLHDFHIHTHKHLSMLKAK